MSWHPPPMPVDDEDSLARYAAMFDRRPTIPMPADYASVMCDRIERTIAGFQERLAADEEVGAAVTHFGRAVTIRITGLGYQNPHLVVMYGTTDDGTKCELVQHVSQVNFLLLRLKAADPKNPRRIGFNFEESKEDER